MIAKCVSIYKEIIAIVIRLIVEKQMFECRITYCLFQRIKRKSIT